MQNGILVKNSFTTLYILKNKITSLKMSKYLFY
jgi:hypothetical protein